MKLFEDFTIKFEKPNWSRDPELCLTDTILEKHPNFIVLLQEDITKGKNQNIFGRKDASGVEQIVRAAIYKELKSLKLRPYSFQLYQK